MARRKKHKAKKEYYDPPIWVEGHRFNEKTGKQEPIKYKLRKRCF